MKKSYINRAQKFIKDLLPFIEDFSTLSEIEYAVRRFNEIKHRKVKVMNGSVRVVFITSDYVVKMNYDDENAEYWGGNCEEANMYQIAINSGMEYLFAPATLWEYMGVEWIIMPRINNIGNYNAWKTISDEDKFWLRDTVDDIHNGNYGIWHGHFVMIDYACALNWQGTPKLSLC